ncbi:MAG TPA: S-layer homology domain-containing protein [Clostridiaceae bacterium]|nr:S-layer homology domain-containing protein [Clostridiaceae bacterium]
MRKTIILFLVLALLINLLIPINAVAEDMDYLPLSYQITDISNHWAGQTIAALVDREILLGYPDKTFKPDNNTTRAEYLTTLFKTVCVLDESIVPEEISVGFIYYDFYGFRENERREFLKNFSTVDYKLPYNDMEKHWSRNYVAWVKKYCDKKNPGLFEKIFPGENFYPNKLITREEAALVTISFLDPPVRNVGIKFKDVTPDHEFYDEIMYLVNNGIIRGLPDGTFRPEENITRAATAVIMTNVLKEIAYNTDLFANPEAYLSLIASTRDSDYMATFMTEEIYQNPPTELDKKYVAEFKAYELDRQMAQELMSGEIYDILEQKGYEAGTDEYLLKAAELENLIVEKYENLKKEIPYYEPERDRLEVLKELEEKDYWNKAGIYYWIYKLNPNLPIEYLKKAEEAYQTDRNGKDDLYKIYEEFIKYYSCTDINRQKVIEYTKKAEELFIPDEYGNAYIANMEDVRFYPLAAYYLTYAGEYGKALDYMDKLFAKADTAGVPFETYFSLERGVLMYLSGQKDEAVQYLKENLDIAEKEEYADENLINKYIWALKSIQRLESK